MNFEGLEELPPAPATTSVRMQPQELRCLHCESLVPFDESLAFPDDVAMWIYIRGRLEEHLMHCPSAPEGALEEFRREVGL